MKKLLVLLVVFSFVLTGCGGADKGNVGTYEIALVTDEGDINDKSFNQSAWEAVEQFAKETDGMTYKYYKPADFNTAGYHDAIEQAIDNGAKVIVCPGFKFEDAVGTAQTEYPDVKFILIDATPKVEKLDADGKVVLNDDGSAVKEVLINENVYCVAYLEQQPGYLAGYGAVKDGYTKLGFMGGLALPAVVNFGYGYVQGALAAAKELGITIEMKYKYTGSFSPSPEIKTEASAWYNEGTEVIFACGGGICESIFAAAQEAGAKTIGVDSDQKDDSETVITSAMKGVNKSTYDALVAYKDGSFPTGAATLDASGAYVGLSEDFSRFTSFDKAAYDEIFASMADGELSIKGFADYSDLAGDPTPFADDSMTVKYYK